MPNISDKEKTVIASIQANVELERGVDTLEKNVVFREEAAGLLKHLNSVTEYTN